MTAIDRVYLSMHKNSSNLMMTWDEPSLGSRPSVDYYLVGVNQRELNVTSPRANAVVTCSESIKITIRYSNCLEYSPTVTFNFSCLIEGNLA